MNAPLARNCRFAMPDLGVGIGLRAVHYDAILEQRPAVDWFEVISENYLYTKGRPLHYLERIAERYPIVLHGVSLAIGNTDALDLDYLARLKDLARRVRPAWVSDHLCWTGILHKNTHDLLPLPYTEESLAHVVRRVKQVQDFLERPLVLENPSTYCEFGQSTLTEWDFIRRVAEEADCGLLLDVNNVYVSGFNHGFDPEAYIRSMPQDRIVQYHLAGHTNHGTHIIDTHNDHVIDAVWELFRKACAASGGRATLIEWDSRIPALEVLVAEAQKAKAHIAASLPRGEAAVAP